MDRQEETLRGPQRAESGEFAGWLTWPLDHFETQSGPFFHRVAADGVLRCAFRAGRKHMNNSGAMHGGCLMTFADYYLFVFAQEALAGARGVTVSLNNEFMGAAHEGDLVEGTGETVKHGRALIFVRGLVRSGERPLLNFSGTIMRMRPRSPRS